MAASAQGGHLSLVGFGAPNWPSLYGLLWVTTMPESVRNNAKIPTYLGRSNQVDVAGGDRDHSCLEVKQRSRFSVAACGQGSNAGAAVPQWLARRIRHYQIKGPSHTGGRA